MSNSATREEVESLLKRNHVQLIELEYLRKEVTNKNAEIAELNNVILELTKLIDELVINKRESDSKINKWERDICAMQDKIFNYITKINRIELILGDK